MSPAFVFLHLLPVVAAAFLIGVRAFRETQPRAVAASGDVRQLQRLSIYAGFGLLLMSVGFVVGLDLGFLQVAKVLQ